jgi:hypothetical protein
MGRVDAKGKRGIFPIETYLYLEIRVMVSSVLKWAGTDLAQKPKRDLQLNLFNFILWHSIMHGLSKLDTFKS